MNTLLSDVEPIGAANPLLEPSPGLMVWTLLTFGITLFIISRYVLGPVSAQIEKRRDEIARSIEEAEQSRDEALQLLDEYKSRLAEARGEADALREQGRKEGEREGRDLITAAQSQRERVVADAQSQIDAQTRDAASGLRDDVVDLAMLAARKVSGTALTEADHRRLIEEAIDGADMSVLSKG